MLRDTVWNSELGNAGFTIDSLMLKYQGVDWRNTKNWNCNAGCVLRIVLMLSMLCVMPSETLPCMITNVTSAFLSGCNTRRLMDEWMKLALPCH